MKAQELRIGNIVLDDYSEEVYVISICKEGLEVSYSGDNDESTKYLDISEINSLLITPELLERAGFIKRGIYYHFPDNDIFKLEQYKNKNAFWLRHGTELIDCVRINYYHQLQNLYFALTGEEITI